MGEKYPIRYQLIPETIDKGSHWITVKLENIGTTSIRNLEIEFNSKDSSSLSLWEPYQWLGSLEPGEEEVLPFKVNASRTTDVYITISALMDSKYFSWESQDITIDVGLEVADISSLFILARPYTTLDETLEVEAAIEAKQSLNDVSLEFWLEDPFGALEKLGSISTGEMESGEERRYMVEFTPSHKGVYKVTGYLYHEDRLISKVSDNTII